MWLIGLKQLIGTIVQSYFRTKYAQSLQANVIKRYRKCFSCGQLDPSILGTKNQDSRLNQSRANSRRGAYNSGLVRVQRSVPHESLGGQGSDLVTLGTQLG